MTRLHHVEIWLDGEPDDWGDWAWLLGRCGLTLESSWPEGQSWAAGDTSLVLTGSPNLARVPHDRRRPGMNHIALGVGERTVVDAIVRDATAHGWTPLYADRYPHAGGAEHYACWLESTTGFKVEVVADD